MSGPPPIERSSGDSEDWLITYADAITLLMAFFVVMFSISEPNTEKWLDINTEYADKWPNINRMGEPPADADEWRDKTGKAEYFSPNPGQGS